MVCLISGAMPCMFVAADCADIVFSSHADVSVMCQSLVLNFTAILLGLPDSHVHLQCITADAACS